MIIEKIKESEIFNVHKGKISDFCGTNLYFGQEISNSKITIQKLIFKILEKRNYELEKWDIKYEFDESNREYKVILNHKRATNQEESCQM